MLLNYCGLEVVKCGYHSGKSHKCKNKLYNSTRVIAGAKLNRLVGCFTVYQPFSGYSMLKSF